MSTPEQWAFADNPDSERWTGPYATKHEAITEALSYYGDPDDGHKPCVALCRPVKDEDDDVQEGWTFMVEGEPELIDFS